MPAETAIQAFLHAFEQGRPADWLRRILVGVIIIGVASAWILVQFNGFSSPEAMDQAQIGRQIANGRGYTTLYARPLAMHLMLARTGKIPQPLPEVSQAPLGPLINAAAFSVAGTKFNIPQREVVSPADRTIAYTSFLFFAGALMLIYVLARTLFDRKTALIGLGLVIASDLVWRFTFSGLPQAAMLFFFSGALLSLVGAMNTQATRQPVAAFFLTLLSALLLGIVTLGNGLGLWIFAGFWVFASIVIKPRWLTALATPGIYALPLLPWAWHNWRAMRHPLGESFYQLYREAGTAHLAQTADFEPILSWSWSNLARLAGENFLSQAAEFPSYFGYNVVAAAFFLGLLFLTFQRWQAAQFRWAIFAMWSGATLGMFIFGVSGAVSVNQLHFLFLPMMVFYGFTFLMMMWERFEISQPFLRGAFIVLLYLVVSLQLIVTLTNTPARVNWPPYLPPLVQRFSLWLDKREAMAADIPWATAWYAGRQSILLPESIAQFELVHRERLLGMPLVAIYLTPFSGNNRTYADIVNGRYRDWARFVMRDIKQEELKDWFITSAVNLPIDGESIFFADRQRWR